MSFIATTILLKFIVHTATGVPAEIAFLVFEKYRGECLGTEAKSEAICYRRQGTEIK